MTEETSGKVIKIKLDNEERQLVEHTVDGAVKRFAQEVQRLRQIQDNLNNSSLLSKALVEMGDGDELTLDEANTATFESLIEAMPYGRVKGLVEKMAAARG